MDEEIRLSYSAQSSQVRLSIPFELIGLERKPPSDLVKRAKSKLEDEQSQGKIEDYLMYEDALAKYWAYLRALNERPEAPINFCLAQGFRKYSDIHIKPGPGKREWLLSINASPELLAKIGRQRFLAFLLKETGLEPYANPGIIARLVESYWRALKQETIVNRLITDIALPAELLGSKFSNEKTQGLALLWINDKKLLNTAVASKVLGQVQVFFDKNKAVFANYELLQKESRELLTELSSAPESHGFGLPVALPIGLRPIQIPAAAPLVKAAAEASGEKSKLSDLPEFKKLMEASPGKPVRTANTLLEFDISPDGMEAQISWSNDPELQKAKIEFDRKWIEGIFKAAGIRYGYEPLLENVLGAVTLGQKLKGMIVAKGMPSQSGQHVYVHRLYLDKTLSEDQAVIDMRAAQMRYVVDVADPIAELRYRDGKPGMTVRGEVLHETVPYDAITTRAGDGAELRSDGRFYAKIRGVPKIERYQVSCLDVYVHRGDVNLKSGNINFDGSVEVKGNVDNGARIHAKGDIIVRGMIGHAYVHCSGDLSVSKGVVTSQAGLIHVGGDFSAYFVENSRLVVAGNVEVDQSILNSDCKIGGDVLVKSPTKGMIGGGLIVTGGSISTHDLGFQQGEKTFCHVGSDWRLEHKLSLLKGRETKVQDIIKQRQYEFDESMKKKSGEERVKLLDKKLKKAQRVLRKIERLCEAISGRIRWSHDVILSVRGLADPNCEVMIGGRSVPMPKPVREVMITPSRFRDQFVNSLIYIEQYKKIRRNESDAI